MLDPRDGRWLQRDPIGYASDWNLYQHASGDPFRFVDPSGTCAVKPDDGLEGIDFSRPVGLQNRARPGQGDAVLFGPGERDQVAKRELEALLQRREDRAVEMVATAALTVGTVALIAVPDPTDVLVAGFAIAGKGAIKVTCKQAAAAAKNGFHVVQEWNESQAMLKVANGGKGLPSTEAAKLWTQYKEYYGIHKVGDTLDAARKLGVQRAWDQEMRLVQKTGKGTREWSEAELAMLRHGKRPTGYEGHHINSVAANPSLADVPDNIEFVTRVEHYGKHGNDWRNPSSGKLLDRSKRLKEYEESK